ncbi:MAG: hypothetical protein SNJ82_11660, partial [Gemmataceae bacterium]
LFEEQFAESFERVLNHSSWLQRRDPTLEYQRICQEVEAAIRDEDDATRTLRQQLLPALADSARVEGAGVYQADLGYVQQLQYDILFAGNAQACDGISQIHDSLATTIYQLGIALVSYGGHENCWHQTLFRRDLRSHHPDASEQVLALLQRREQRPGSDHDSREQMTELARRGILLFMEREILTHVATALWRIGHGSPAPLEMVATGYSDLVVRSIRLIRALLAHERFLFVASDQSNRMLATIGNCLRPMEFVVIDSLNHYPGLKLDHWNPDFPAGADLRWNPSDAEPIPLHEWLRRFREEVATQMVYGLFRASPLAPARVFFAHRKHSHTAAHLALADSCMLEVRGFPLLIDLADRTCRAIYGGGTLQEMTEAAYARAGVPFPYPSEQDTRLWR